MDEIIVTKSLKQRYDKAATKRQPYLDRAREAAKYTIPTLIPPENTTSNTTFEEPNQSIGADGINNLSSKLTLTILPPNTPFFKFSGDVVKLRAEAEANGRDADEEEKAQNEALSKLEQYIKDRIESHGDRIVLGEAFKHLLIGGNVLMVDDKDDGLKYYPLSRYVVKRDYSGNVLFVITTEKVAFEVLPSEVQEQLRTKIQEAQGKTPQEDAEYKEYVLYTVFERDNKQWKIWQEVEGIKLEGTEGSYPIDKCPFIALRYVPINGEDYGRGFIEEYIGDLRYLDVISKAIKEASLAASKFIVLVDPNGITKAEKLRNTVNGGFCVGKESDVSVLQAHKYYDLKTAESVSEKIERRLARVFLLAESVQRDAERVPNTEVKFMIKELEEALGNFYSMLSKNLQKPYLIIKYHHLKLDNKNLPDILKDNNIQLIITSGIEALGRSNELQKFSLWINMMSESQIIQQMGGDIAKLGDIYAAALGLNIEGIIPSKEELAAQQQEAQQAEMMKQIAPGIIQQSGQAIQNVQKSMLSEGEG